MNYLLRLESPSSIYADLPAWMPELTGAIGVLNPHEGSFWTRGQFSVIIPAMNVAHMLDSGNKREVAVLIFCPACKYGHAFYIKVVGNRPVWEWNGSLEKPTFHPSMLVFARSTNDPKFRDTPRCHSFVKEGKIQFLGDCTHAMAGKTVDLEPF